MHCVLLWGGVKPHLRNRRLNLKNWTLILDVDGAASLFQNCLREMLQKTSNLSCEVLEDCLLESGKQYGISGGKTVAFKPSPALMDLRNNRRQTVDTVRRKELSFHIRKLHRQELRQWRSTKLSAYLCNPSSWKVLRVMLRTPCYEVADQPHADDFAEMLARLFHGDPAPPMTRPTLTEPPWTMAELKHAISRLKVGRTGDYVGLVAELLKHSPDDFLNALLHVMTRVLTSGNVPKTCRPIRRSSAPGRTQIQGAHIPRTSPFQTVQARGPRPRDRGPVEPGSNNFPPPLGPDKSQSSSQHPPQSCGSFPPLTLVSHPHTCGPAGICGQSPGLRLRRHQHYRWGHPLHQPASLRSAPSPPAYQPCPSPP